MKKIVASVGLVALGASGIETASAQALTAPDSSRPWSVSGTLRGFYDDNVGTVPNGATLPAGQQRGSFGFELSPSGTLAWSSEQTTASLGVLYSLKYYNHEIPGTSDHTDQAVTFNGAVTHAFSERYQGRLSDSFALGQEPDLLRAGQTFSTVQRNSGNNIRNYGALGFDAQLTPEVGVSAGYDNAFYDYARSGGNAFEPSPAGTLNRIENGVHVDGLYTIQPQTKARVGFGFRQTSFTADENIGFDLANGTFIRSDSRDNRQYRFYVGADHNFLPNLTASLDVGASYNDFYNDVNPPSPWGPYVNGSLRYTYGPESYVEGGIKYDRVPTDQAGTGGISSTGFTTDQQAATIYASINHRITPKIFGSLLGQFQNSTFNGGSIDGDTEQFYLLGLNLEYRFNQYFSAHAGYNYDNLASGIGRSYDRNRVYIGVTARY